MDIDEFDKKILSTINKFDKNSSDEDFETFFIIAMNDEAHMVYEGGEPIDILKLIGVLDLAKSRLLQALSPAIKFEGSLQ